MPNRNQGIIVLNWELLHATIVKPAGMATLETFGNQLRRDQADFTYWADGWVSEDDSCVFAAIGY